LTWLGLPMLVCAAAMVLVAIPFRLFGFALPEPVFPMVLAFAWAVIRPSILGPLALFLIGMFTDLFWGGPVGLWTLSLLLAYLGILVARTLMVGQSGRVLWGWYIVCCLFAFGCAYVFTMMNSDAAPNLYAVGFQLLVTTLLYPFAHRLIDRFEDADVRFR
jgi:rod shape-determining protein MreD